MAIFSYYPWLFPVFATILGLLVGSFLNVVIYRLPIMMERQWRNECIEAFPDLIKADAKLNTGTFNLSVPRSRCPHCGHLICAVENIPVISWLVLKGKCRSCHAPISRRYPMIELLTATVCGTVAILFPPTWWAVAVIFFTFALIALTFIDIDKMLLPDQITLPLLWAGIFLALLGISPVSLQDSVMGAIAGYLCLWSVFWVFKLLTQKDGMGYGDFKLLAALGAWLGWQMLPVVILLSSLAGAICGIILLKVKKSDHQTPFSFGPYLAIAGWISLLWGHSIMTWYVSNMLGM